MIMVERPVSHRFAAIWGMSGVITIVLFAIVRLSPIVLSALAVGLDALQWLVLVANVGFMAWSEGYRGFQLKFSPRVAARALYLYREPTSSWIRFMAPLFCIGYFAASPRTRTIAWIGTIGIVVLVLLVHRLDQPWRGIIDAGVVVGLTWGLISLIVWSVSVWRSGRYPVSPKVPGYNGD